MMFPRNRWSDSGPIKGAIARMLYAATGISTRLALLATLTALVAMAAVDDALGARWSLGLFYYLPVAFAAWRLGRMPGLVSALLAALAWSGLSVSHTAFQHMPLALIWGFASRALSFAFAAIIVAEMRLLFERERTLGRYCHLTGALSGRAFRDLLDEVTARARHERRSISLVYIDLDDFKQVNDRFGHSAGDARLRAFAGAIRAVLTPRDQLARTGGDEFVVLLTGHEGRERAAIDHVRRAAAAALAVPSMPTTASMGAVIVPAGMAADAGDLVRRADAAMYQGKRAGKGQLLVFEMGAPGRMAAAA